MYGASREAGGCLRRCEKTWEKFAILNWWKNSRNFHKFKYALWEFLGNFHKFKCQLWEFLGKICDIELLKKLEKNMQVQMWKNLGKICDIEFYTAKISREKFMINFLIRLFYKKLLRYLARCNIHRYNDILNFFISNRRCRNFSKKKFFWTFSIDLSMKA